MGRHFIVIALDNFRASYMLNQSWQQVDYESGDIAIIPASQAFPRTQIDREVPLVELFLEPAILNRVACESADADNIESELVKFFHNMAFKESPLFRHINGSVAYLSCAIALDRIMVCHFWSNSQI
jgi:hypothetical protein